MKYALAFAALGLGAAGSLSSSAQAQDAATVEQLATGSVTSDQTFVSSSSMTMTTSAARGNGNGNGNGNGQTRGAPTPLIAAGIPGVLALGGAYLVIRRRRRS